jgi:hypothetical protein
MASFRPDILLVIARGEAVRNFLYSDTLPALAERARVSLLSSVEHGEVMERVCPYVDQVIPLRSYREKPLVNFYRETLHMAHFRWLWSENVKSYWGRRNAKVRGNPYEMLKLASLRMLALPLASPPGLRQGTRLEQWLSWRLRPCTEFESLFARLQPDLVFNSSQVHGSEADLPLRVAHGLGIRTAAFIFSWDNLTSRSRIMVPYDHYLVWTDGLKRQFLDLYPEVSPERVSVTGTPQFDYHFKSEFLLSREELACRAGLDPARPFILYTTGRDVDFPDEHKIVAEVIRFVKALKTNPRPQMLVRTYVKGNSRAMAALADTMKDDPDVVFPTVLWDRQWIMPLHDDLAIYTSLLRHTALGINPASTVSLELMMFGKPVINLAFEPPESNLPEWSRFSRHVGYEHYRPVAASGGVMIARSLDELKRMILRGLAEPNADCEAQKRFLDSMFGDMLDGNAAKRVADQLICLSNSKAAQ